MALSQQRPDEERVKLLTGLPELNGEREIIVNFETTGLRWWDKDRIIGMSYHLPESNRDGYVPLRHSVGENVDVAAWRRWANALEHVRLKNINTKFDVHMAEADEIGWRDRETVTYSDVAHDAALLDDSRIRFNLDQLCAELLDWDVSDDKMPRGIETEKDFHLLHPGIVAPYAIRNAMQVQALDEHFAPQILEQELTEVQGLERELIPCTVEFERNGMYLDVPLLEQWHREVADKIDTLKSKIYKESGVKITSFDSSKQAANLFERRGLKSTMKTDGGEDSFAGAVLKEFSHDPVIAAFYQGGQLADLHSKYLDKYLKTVDSNGWIRYNLHQLRTTREDGGKQGTVSGRFSAAGDREGGFNPQQVVSVEKQLERGWCTDYVIRKLFRAAPGYSRIIAADMMQVEYRLFAHYAKMHDAFHAEPLQKIIGGKPVWIQGPLADFHALVAELLNNPLLNRKLVKNINFAIIYGAGAWKFAMQMGITTQAEYEDGLKMFNGRPTVRQLLNSKYGDKFRKALDTRRAYDERFPAVSPMLKLASSTARDRGYVKTLMNRRARFGGHNNRYHSALNRIVQGGAADINKRAIIETYKQRKSIGFHMMATVHDEIVGSGNEGTLPAVDKVLNTQYFDLRVPILWDSKEGSDWAACK